MCVFVCIYTYIEYTYSQNSPIFLYSSYVYIYGMFQNIFMGVFERKAAARGFRVFRARLRMYRALLRIYIGLF